MGTICCYGSKKDYFPHNLIPAQQPQLGVIKQILRVFYRGNRALYFPLAGTDTRVQVFIYYRQAKCILCPNIIPCEFYAVAYPRSR